MKYFEELYFLAEIVDVEKLVVFYSIAVPPKPW
jgi:hypothetical protein